MSAIESLCVYCGSSPERRSEYVDGVQSRAHLLATKGIEFMEEHVSGGGGSSRTLF